MFLRSEAGILPSGNEADVAMELPELCIDHARQGIRELNQLISDPKYCARYIDVCSEQANSALENFIQTHYRRLALPLVRQAARELMQQQAAESPMTLKTAFQNLTSVDCESDGFSRNYKLPQDTLSLVVSLMGANEQDQIQQLAEYAAQQSRSAHRRLQALAFDLQEQGTSKELYQAMSVWGLSRNLDKSSGPERNGFHAGIVHYFEYHADPKKRLRFIDSNTQQVAEMSLDRYIRYSTHYYQLLVGALRGERAQVDDCALIGDQEGRARCYLLTRNTIVIGFQRQDQDMKLLSVLRLDEHLNHREKFQALVAKEMDHENAHLRFNKLGTRRRLVDSYR